MFPVKKVLTYRFNTNAPFFDTSVGDMWFMGQHIVVYLRKFYGSSWWYKLLNSIICIFIH